MVHFTMMAVTWSIQPWMINASERRPGEGDNFIQYSRRPGLHLNPWSPKYEPVVVPTRPTMGVNDKENRLQW